MPRRKGVRKYFSRPLKGFTTYGSKKRWRSTCQDRKSSRNSLVVKSVSPSCSSMTLEEREGNMSPLSGAFLGFEVPAYECIDTNSNDIQRANPPANIVSPLFSSVTHEQHQHSISPPYVGFLGFDVPHYESIDPTNSASKRRLRVLSLFDGISTGLHILSKTLKMDLDVYYSSEIDINAIKVQKENYSDLITPLGSVCNLTETVIDSLGRIDLLIGGSPCSDLSLVNPRRRGLTDHSSSGSLFFNYVETLQYLKKRAYDNGETFFWLFENTNRMEKADIDLISQTLRCSPVTRDAADYVPMRRARLFWGNIPDMTKVPKRNGVPPLQDFLKPGRIAVVETLPTLTTRQSSQRSGNGDLPVMEDGVPSFLLITEQEVLFGFPENYTGCRNLSISQRRQLLGKSWSVHVVSDILKPLTDRYRTLCWMEVP